LHGNRPSFGLYFTTAALANIPFWIYTGVIGFLGLQGDVYVLLMFVTVLAGGIIGGRFLANRLAGRSWTTGFKAAAVASIVNIFFGVGTFSIDYIHVLVLVLFGFAIGGPVGSMFHTREQRSEETLKPESH
jgi:uncharacterized protein YneF (UPF0154 family)